MYHRYLGGGTRSVLLAALARHVTLTLHILQLGMLGGVPSHMWLILMLLPACLNVRVAHFSQQ